MATIPTTFRDMEQSKFNKVMEELKQEPKYLIAMGNAADTVCMIDGVLMQCALHANKFVEYEKAFTLLNPEDLEKLVSWKDRVQDDNITGVLAEMQETPVLLDLAASFVLDLVQVKPETLHLPTSEDLSLFRKNISDNVSLKMAAAVLKKYTAQAVTDEDVKKAGEKLEEAAGKAAEDTAEEKKEEKKTERILKAQQKLKEAEEEVKRAAELDEAAQKALKKAKQELEEFEAKCAAEKELPAAPPPSRVMSSL